MEPKPFARKTINSVARNTPIIVVPSWYQLLLWPYRLFPTFMLWIASIIYRSAKKGFDAS